MSLDAVIIIEGLFKAFIFVPCMALVAWWLVSSLLDRTIDIAEAAVGFGLLAIAFLLGVRSITSGGWGFLGVLSLVYVVLLAFACGEYVYWRQREKQHWLDEIAKYVDATQRDPANAAAFSFLGQAYLKLRWFDEAVEAFEKALEIEPESRRDAALLQDARERQSRTAWYQRRKPTRP